MVHRSKNIRRRLRIAVPAVVLALATASLALVQATPASAATQGPCDIYASGGTPCVAAHSTTRALYAAYNGPLYQVRRSTDSATLNVGVVAAGGIANSAAQDSFCANTTCVITVIYDQSGKGNNLTQAPAGGFNGPAAAGADNLANAVAAPTTLNGSKVYGVFIAPGTGYRDNTTKGIATGDQPEGMYAIMDGTHYNNACCFDYGNAETDSHDDGNGTMEAIYFGNNTDWGRGAASGPWIMADLENGLYAGSSYSANTADPSITNRYETAMVKGTANQWAIRGSNAQSGSVSTYYSGVRPTSGGYNPMRKQGAIILGIGGDNSNGAAGTFYEGVMTSGYPSDATENSVQANIVAAGYGKTPSSQRALTVGSKVSLQATTACCTADYIQHDSADSLVVIAPVSSTSSTTDKADATWIVEPGLADAGCISFQSANVSASYLRHSNFEAYLNANDGTSTFAQDATFCPTPGQNGANTYAFPSFNYPSKSLRHYNYKLYLAGNGGSNAWDSPSLYAQDTSWNATAPWAP